MGPQPKTLKSAGRSLSHLSIKSLDIRRDPGIFLGDIDLPAKFCSSPVKRSSSGEPPVDLNLFASAVIEPDFLFNGLMGSDKHGGVGELKEPEGGGDFFFSPQL